MSITTIESFGYFTAEISPPATSIYEQKLFKTHTADYQDSIGEAYNFTQPLKLSTNPIINFLLRHKTNQIANFLLRKLDIEFSHDVLDTNDCISSSSEVALYEVIGADLTEIKYLVFKELYRYTALPDDWDGAGAKSVSENIRIDAERFVENYPFFLAAPSPMLTNEGELSFYWDSSLAYIDLLLNGDGLASVYIHDRTKNTDIFLPVELHNVNHSWFIETFSILDAPATIAA